MPIELTAEGLRKIFPHAPQDIIDAFVAKQSVLEAAGILATRGRLGYFFANIEHECGGFTIRDLTESTAYTHNRVAQIWPSRFSSGDAVRARYGSASGWQRAMLDDVYGNRMGNRPGTRDGSRYIGRGGPQWTGRDGYAELARRTGLPAVEQPEVAARHDVQPEVCTAFWSWKNLNALADAGDFRGTRRRWNGGYIGIADVEAKLVGNDPIIRQLAFVEAIRPTLTQLPGAPASPAPPPEVMDEATRRERAAVKTGGTAAAGGAAGEVVSTQTQQPDKPVPMISPLITWTAIGLGIAVLIVGVVLLARRRAAVMRNWF